MNISNIPRALVEQMEITALAELPDQSDPDTCHIYKGPDVPCEQPIPEIKLWVTSYSQTTKYQWVFWAAKASSQDSENRRHLFYWQSTDCPASSSIHPPETPCCGVVVKGQLQEQEQLCSGVDVTNKTWTCRPWEGFCQLSPQPLHTVRSTTRHIWAYTNP